MSALADKIRRARESKVEAGGHTFTIRRPTDAEAQQFADGADAMVLARRFVIGWDLAELDLIPGGSPEPAAFDEDAFAEWVGDHPVVLGKLVNAIVDRYVEHAKVREDAEKN